MRRLCLTPPASPPAAGAALSRLIADDVALASGRTLPQRFRGLVARRGVGAMGGWLGDEREPPPRLQEFGSDAERVRASARCLDLPPQK